MALRREVHHGLGAVGGQQRVQRGPVADIGLGEDVAWLSFHGGQAAAVAGVGQLVQIDDAVAVVPPQPVEHEVAADEAGAAGDEKGCHRSLPGAWCLLPVD
ncbi:hypothetical protein D3C72_1767260 [compost metagenome]